MDAAMIFARQRAYEIFKERQKIVAERLLVNISHSSHYEHLGALRRIDMAYDLAAMLLHQPIQVDVDGPEPPFPGTTFDGFIVSGVEDE